MPRTGWLAVREQLPTFDQWQQPSPRVSICICPHNQAKERQYASYTAVKGLHVYMTSCFAIVVFRPVDLLAAGKQVWAVGLVCLQPCRVGTGCVAAAVGLLWVVAGRAGGRLRVMLYACMHVCRIGD
jgi:hypothetical protein